MKRIDKNAIFDIFERITKSDTAENLKKIFSEIIIEYFDVSNLLLFEVIEERSVTNSRSFDTVLVDVLNHEKPPFIIKKDSPLDNCLKKNDVVHGKINSTSINDFLYPIQESYVITHILKISIREEKKALEDIKPLVKIFGNQLSILHERDKDGLTGLYNRNYYNKVSLLINYSDIEENVKKYTHLAIIDIDFFKKVNDVYGHLIGDEVLINFASLIKTLFRREDSKIRYGGEEFCILLKEIGNDEAYDVIERFRSAVETHKFPRIGHMTVSIGYSEILKVDDPFSVYDKADKALYYAKDNGRNQVINSVALKVLEKKEPVVRDITLWED